MKSTAKEIFFTGKHVAGYWANCKYYKLSETSAVEIGESRDYVYGCKLYAVTVVDSGKEVLSQVFSDGSTEKNSRDANEFLDEILNKAKLLKHFKTHGYIVDKNLFITIVADGFVYMDEEYLAELYQGSTAFNAKKFLGLSDVEKKAIFKKVLDNAVALNGLEIIKNFDRHVVEKYAFLKQ